MTNFDQKGQIIQGNQYNAGGNIITNIHTSVPALSPEERNQRANMLAKVDLIWVRNILERSLENTSLIVPTLGERPDLIDNPLRHSVQESNQPASILPPGTLITQVYENAANELLILGEPGSGKTTLLLELTRDLLIKAKQDVMLPMPVVFNLSSWPQKKLSLVSWLVEELNTIYDVSRKLGKAWIEMEKVLPLLDGLDEVVEVDREACLQAINTYRKAHGLVPTVVCSRTIEYERLKTKILLKKAIVIQPLTLQQMDAYLTDTTGQLKAIRDRLHTNHILQNLATPLMLYILKAAYPGSNGDLPEAGSPEAMRSEIFTQYIQNMFRRRAAETRYTQQQTELWLTWLAQQMKHRSSLFYIEQMQPDWLSSNLSTRTYYGITAALAGGFIIGLPMGLIIGPLGSIIAIPLITSYQSFCLDIVSSVIKWLNPLIFRTPPIVIETSIIFLFATLLCMLLTGVFLALASAFVAILFNIGTKEIHTSEIIVWSWPSLRRGFIEGFAIAMTGTFIIEFLFLFIQLLPSGTSLYTLINSMIVHEQNNLFFAGLIGWILIGPVSGIIGGCIIGVGRRIVQKKRDHVIRNSIGTGVRTGCFGILISTILFALIGLPIFYHIVSYIPQTFISFIFGIIFALSTGIGGGLITGIPRSFLRNELSEDKRVKPNEGIRRSLHNSMWTMLLVGGGTWLFLGWLFWLAIQQVIVMIDNLSGTMTFQQALTPSNIDKIVIGVLLVGFIIGYLSGTISGFLTGGYACMQHFALRLLLFKSRYIPWRYSHFLDYAVQRILLRRVGGGYTFINRQLLEHFASLNNLDL